MVFLVGQLGKRPILASNSRHPPRRSIIAPPLDSNGRFDDEAPEPQQTLFSWGPFMAEELVKPKGRSRTAASLFDWALSLEEERE